MVCLVLDVFKTTQEVNILPCCRNFLLFLGLFLTLWDMSGHSNSKPLDWLCWFLLSVGFHFCWVLIYEYCLLVSLVLSICILIILSLHLQCDTFLYFCLFSHFFSFFYSLYSSTLAHVQPLFFQVCHFVYFFCYHHLHN